MTKPVGVFEPGNHPPAWVTFGNIKDVQSDGEFIAARRLSESRPFLWVLELGGAEPVTQPIGEHAALVRERLIATGLLPYVIAIMYREEWYEQWQGGRWTDIGFPPSFPGGVEVIRSWAGQQHARIKAVFRLPIVWLTTAANNDPRLTPYQPVPDHVDYVGITAFIAAGQTFESIKPVLQHAERTTSLPLLLTAQWFTEDTPDSPWRQAPRSDDVVAYLAWAQRPRWVGVMGFTWASSPASRLTGLADMPATRILVERSMGIRQ